MDIKTIKRFWSNVTKRPNNKCWEWIGGCFSFGYGCFNFNRKSFAAHRISYQLKFGDLSPDLCVLHKCDNPKCVNPSHLFLGTRQDNVIDKVKKGRQHSKLNYKKAERIRKLYNSKNYTLVELANKFRVAFSTIARITNNKGWIQAKNY